MCAMEQVALYAVFGLEQKNARLLWDISHSLLSKCGTVEPEYEVFSPHHSVRGVDVISKALVSCGEIWEVRFSDTLFSERNPPREEQRRALFPRAVEGPDPGL